MMDVQCQVGDSREDVKGSEYFGPSKRRETAGPAIQVKSTGYSHNEEVASRLWDLSIEMTGVDPGF